MNKIIQFEKQIVSKTSVYVRKKLSNEGSGHDWWHTYRVWKLARTICTSEKANSLIVELAALLHDVYDWKFNNGSEEKTIKHTSIYLSKQSLKKEYIDHICQIIQTMSFKGEGSSAVPKTIEGQIVQDADRLDAIGAIGISRVFTYGGYTNREIYNPDIKPKKFKTKKEYLDNKGTSINHFYEKLLLLKDLMNTKSAKIMAIKRHKFLLEYLSEFYKEWEGLK